MILRLICFLTVTILIIVTISTVHVKSHGIMIKPVGRASRWRFNESAPININDNELFCGGITNTWEVHGGKCGICGDDYGLPIPRPHESGGEYGTGVIVGTYRSGTDIQVAIKVTANHNGYFTFDICNLDQQKETEECFEKLRLDDGTDKYYLTSSEPGMFFIDVFIPRYLICEHCVLRWQYTAGNMWGECSNGTGAVGCGPQEKYFSCADITINSAGPRGFNPHPLPGSETEK